MFKVTKKQENVHFRQLYQIISYKYITLKFSPNKQDFAVPDWDEDFERLSSVHMSISVDTDFCINVNV